MKFVIIRSGSSGNCTVVYEKNTLILVDMGITKKILCEELNKIGKKFEDIDAVLFTHDHADHIKGREFFPDDLVYGGVGVCKMPESHILSPFNKVKLKDLTFTPFPLEHDATSPLGYLFEDNHSSFALFADTGFIKDKCIDLCKNCDYYQIESNHDVKMELKTHRPPYLKERILGDYGHLSNADSALYVTRLVGERTKQVFYAHLSDEANTHELALKTHRKIYKQFDISPTFEMLCTSQEHSVCGGDLNEN